MYLSYSRDGIFLPPKASKAASIGAPHNSLDCPRSIVSHLLTDLWDPRVCCSKCDPGCRLIKPEKGLRTLKAIRKVTPGIEILSRHSDTIIWTFSVSYYFWAFVYSFSQVWNIFPLFCTNPNPIYSSKPTSNFLRKLTESVPLPPLLCNFLDHYITYLCFVISKRSVNCLRQCSENCLGLRVIASPLANCAILGKWLDFSEVQFPNQ